ncbi:MAG TPA: TIGR00730 family Rossman fold protein [bacterium]|nr:TIGR00730 family Rossman fold protein [bacterium]
MKEHLKAYIDESKTAHVRGLRILLEYFYATEIFEEITRGGVKIISIFGSARTKPHSAEYRLAHQLGGLLYKTGFAVVTGASRGIMQAANQGVADAIAEEIVKGRKARTPEEARETALYQKRLKSRSVGLSISLPMESENNPFVGVSATFHYFMVRKFFFGTLSSGFIACEGGWGTRDELFEILTLVQTGKAPVLPIVYLSPNADHLEQDLRHALRKKYIAAEDLNLLRIVKTPEQAAREISQFYRNVRSLTYERDQMARLVLERAVSEGKKRAVERILLEEMDPQDLEWSGRELLLHGYRPHSYGFLRRAIDLLNRP